MPSAARRLHPQGFVAPCLPTLAREVPDGPQWAHEIKHDGYRMICRRDGDRVRVFSRNALDWTDRVPAIVEAMRPCLPRRATIDGEAVVCDAKGVTDFDALRSALARRQGGSGVFLYAFDLIELGRPRPSAEPWEIRRETLASLATRPSATVFACPSTWTATARRCTGTHASSGSKGSCRSGAMRRTGPGARRIG